MTLCQLVDQKLQKNHSISQNSANIQRYEKYITDSSEIPRHYDKHFVCEKIEFSFKAPISF